MVSQVYIYFNGYDVKGSPFMMRVGTQRRSKSSNSPNSMYRQSPTRSSPSNSHSKPPNYYRPSPSPTLGETQKYAQDYHRLQVEEKHMAPRTVSPSYAPRSPSPTFAPRTQSPSFRPQSPDYISSKKLNDRKYLSPSPNYASKNEYDMSYANKMSSMRLSESRSPAFERSSPEVNYMNSRSNKHTTETRSYNNYDGGIDTSPIVKVSAMADRAAARRDSWDAIAKTRNILSHRSLESVANLTESQLNSELHQKREEEHSSYTNHEQSYKFQKYTSDTDGYGSIDRGYGTTQQYRNGVRGAGAAAVKVQPVPDGVLGQPVEFESEY